MRPSLQDFMKKIKNKTVFLIGGGPSAADVDFSLLKDEVVICINDSIHDFPNATALFWLDDSWIGHNHDIVSRHSCQFRFTSKHSQHVSYINNPDPTTSCNTFILKREGDFGYSPEYDCVMGNNSGVQVLNLVVNMKPKQVVLIGYDMTFKREPDGRRKTHYHNKPRRPFARDVYSESFVPSMNALHKGMVEHGVKVPIINAFEGSGVRCFEFGDYKDFLTVK